jgi:PmbA protein
VPVGVGQPTLKIDELTVGGTAQPDRNTMTEHVQQISEIQNIVDDLLQEARRQGADAAEAAVSAQTGLSVTVRLGETETIEHTSDNGLGITVYFGHRKGSANTTDLRPEAIRESVAAACRIAKYTSEDPAAGLADADADGARYPRPGSAPPLGDDG